MKFSLAAASILGAATTIMVHSVAGLPVNRASNKCSNLPVDPELSLRIIHTNDLHAHYSPFNKYGSDCSPKDINNKNCFGGAARLVTTVKKLREGHPNSLLFDAGDQAQGTLFYTVGKFNTTIKIMNELKYDAMCIGNHEFDDGPDFLSTFFSKIKFPAICANIDMTKNENLTKVVKPYTVIEKYNLGVIGYITNTTGSISNAGPSVSFSDAAEAVNKYVAILRKQGVKRIIAVSHNGYHEDMDLAARTRGLDLIVGGHSHTYLSLNASEPGAGGLYPTIVKNLEGKETYVVQAKAWGEYVGYVDIDFAKDGSVAKLSGEPLHMTLEVPEDPQMASKISEWRKPFDAYGDAVVGSLTAGIGNENCQKRECKIGDLTTDAMLWARNQGTAHTDLAFINSGGIRAGFGSGATKIKDILLVFPFGNSLVSLDLTGKQIRQMIEGVFLKKNIANSRPVTSFIQLAGARVKYHPQPGATNGAKIVESIEIATGKNSWAPLDEAKTYKVATLDFIAKGGDNILDPPVENAAGLRALDVVVSDYFREFSPITPKITGNMIDTTITS